MSDPVHPCSVPGCRCLDDDYPGSRAFIEAAQQAGFDSDQWDRRSCATGHATLADIGVEGTRSSEPLISIPVPDMVNHPPHYTFGRFEVIDVIEDWDLPFHLANTVKYIARAGRKGSSLEDLRKARWYLDRYIDIMESE